MSGFLSLLSSDHGIFSVLLIVAATVLCALGIMSIADWEAFAKFIFATFGATTVGVSIAGAFKKPALPLAPAPLAVVPTSNLNVNTNPKE